MKRLLLLALLVWPGWLVAQGSPGSGKVLLLPLEAEDLDAGQRAAYSQALVGAFKPYKDIILLPTLEGDLFDAMMELECLELDTDCVASFGKKHSADWVVHSIVPPGEQNLRVRVFSGSDGAESRVFVTAPPSPALVSRVAPDVVLKLFGPPPQVKPGDGEITVTASMGKVTVYIDGKRMGTAPVVKRMPPGKITILGRRDGYEDASRTITVVAGKRAKVALTLIAKPKAPPVTALVKDQPPPAAGSSPIYEKWWFWTAVGAGAVAVLVPSIYYLTRPGESPKGSMDLVIHPVTFQDDVLLKKGGQL